MYDCSYTTQKCNPHSYLLPLLLHACGVITDMDIYSSGLICIWVPNQYAGIMSSKSPLSIHISACHLPMDHHDNCSTEATNGPFMVLMSFADGMLLIYNCHCPLQTHFLSLAGSCVHHRLSVSRVWCWTGSPSCLPSLTPTGEHIQMECRHCTAYEHFVSLLGLVLFVWGYPHLL